MRYSRLAFLLAAITSGLLAAAAIAAPSLAHAGVNRPFPRAAATVQHRLVLPAPAAAAARLPVWYTVRSGDSLASIAVRYCGRANDWTGIYTANKAVVGANPNLILPGQHLHVTVCTDPPALLRLGSTWHRTARHALRHATRHGGKIWGVTYGYPYKCGNGDGDGYDTPCTRLHHRTPRRAAAPYRSYSGHYSFAGLEALWISAGGPRWAAPAAARVAECESGGNVHAYNPSGATGLFQILGQVIPGNLYNPYINALNAVAKFKASGDSWAQWVCKP